MSLAGSGGGARAAKLLVPFGALMQRRGGDPEPKGYAAAAASRYGVPYGVTAYQSISRRRRSADAVGAVQLRSHLKQGGGRWTSGNLNALSLEA